MSIQVRTSVFETNSSSMHSIAVRKEHNKLTPEGVGQVWLHDGMKWVYSDEACFGRYPFKMLYTMWDKALYAIASVLGGYSYRTVDDEEAEQFLEGQLYPIIRKFCPEFKGFAFNKDQKDVLIDESNPDEVYCSWDEGVVYRGEKASSSGYVLLREDGKEVPLSVDLEHCLEVMDYGDVDHQSKGLFQGFLASSGVSLEDFLTDSAYVVVIDGDEYDDFTSYLQSGLIRVEDFQTVYASSCWWGKEFKDRLEVKTVSCDD